MLLAQVGPLLLVGHATLAYRCSLVISLIDSSIRTNKTPSSLIILYPDGKYAEISGTLFRERKTGRISICPPCGFIVYKGSWKLNTDGNAVIKSRWVYGGASREGRKPPGPEIEENWKLHGSSKGRVALAIETSKSKYIPLSNLTNLSFLTTAVKAESDH